MSFSKTSLFLFTLLSLGLATFAAPPVAEVRPVSDDYHGTKITDPYRYFENFNDPEVQTWVKGQAVYADDFLRAIPGRTKLLERIHELDKGAPYRIRIVRRWPNGDLHYLKTLASENLDKLYFKSAATGRETLLIDPEKLGDSASGKHVAIDFVVPSPDGKYVAYGLAAAGSEQTVLHVLDSNTIKDLPETIDRIDAGYTDPSWLPDSTGVFYVRKQKLAADAPATDGYKLTKAFLHKLGADPESDKVILAKDFSPKVSLADTDFPTVLVPSGSKYIIGKIKHGDTSELTLYSAPLASLEQPEVSWKKICSAKDEVSDFAVHGEEIDLLTARENPRRKILRTSLESPDTASAHTLLPQSSVVLQSLGCAREALYVNVLDAGLSKVLRLPFDAVDEKPVNIPLPTEEPSGYPVSLEPDVVGALISTSSWIRAGKIYEYHPDTNTLTDTKLRPPGKFDELEGYEAVEVQVASHDGVKVPLSILHKSGIQPDGSHPTLIVGYGSYGSVNYVHFRPTNIAWLERGGVIAIAHVRGGGEFGKEWHEAGRQATKPNTWKDFIACSEYLIKKGYTSSEKLAGLGGSAGGILIGRAITERPDLFAAAIIEVGCTDTLRAETTMNGVPNIAEFGTVATKAGFEALLEMSPYAKVKDGVKYPGVLLVHGTNDPRVDPWMSAKLTARLQAATASKKPVVFRVDYNAGHGIGSTKSQKQELLADEWAFLLLQMNGSAEVK